MKTLDIFTTVYGDYHETVNTLTQQHNEKQLGHAISVIREPDAYLQKLRCLANSSADCVLFIDSDIVFVRPWEPDPTIGSLSAAKLQDIQGSHFDFLKPLGIQRAGYINTGIWMAPNNEEMQKLFRRAEDIYLNEIRDRTDEPPLNKALQETATPIAFWGDCMNRQLGAIPKILVNAQTWATKRPRVYYTPRNDDIAVHVNIPNKMPWIQHLLDWCNKNG